MSSEIPRPESTTAPSAEGSRNERESGREFTRPGPVFRPDVDIVENPEEVIVLADLPGVSADRLRVNLEEGVLSIDGEQARESGPPGTPVYAEYRSGAFHRRFALSERIDGSRIQATLRDGVLELRLPKAERHRSRRIEVHG
ncbi:MAG TPA: Hsp20/alpha crystallin family protein [Myxococcota bacterium]|jgi:HSP20 family protein|nr:Hsp20/alpha crystallin family protein [Myxococcota bacterium]